MVLRKQGFGCNGHVSEWAKCDYFTAKPNRTICTIPTWLAGHFYGMQLVVQDRVFKAVDNELATEPAVRIGDVWQ